MKKIGTGLPFVPNWKVKRELLRIASQGDELFRRATGRSLTYYYARIFTDRQVDFQKGDLILGSRLAVYFMFPSKGLLDSHRIALRYIIKSGYVPVVVSNLPLSPKDQAELCGFCSHLILRPNFGYDFGGYRDAVRLLENAISKLDYLAFFNDSSWFPIRPELDWLQDAESLNLDYVGSVCHEGMSSRKLRDFTTTPWIVDRTEKHFHYGSYSLLIGRELLASSAFWTFWRTFSPTNNKTLTVLRGEIGLTQMVVAKGYSHGAVCDSEGLDRLLLDVSPNRLVEIVGNLVDNGHPGLAKMRADALATDPPDPGALRNLILSTVVREGPAYALIDYDTRERRGNFIKKAPLHWNRTAAEATLRVLSRFDSPEAAVFRHEALAAYEAAYGETWTDCLKL